MAIIKVLRPEVFNKISAGEVVENPTGALKELVENSIDAGATRITIEVKGGGIELISITDNGCGIREDDIDTAFFKHATSKITESEELSSIQTLGFRGEALSSIAAVSKIRLTTRHSDSETAVSATVENGVVLSRQYTSGNVGTKIEVRDLFYNMPARKKFLKSPKYEAMHITKYVSKLILTNPKLDITYVLDGDTVYQSNGAGLESAIFTVYGGDCIRNCLPINFSRGMYRISGYVGAPEFSKANRNYQTLSVNGRLVEDASISGAVLQAYKSYLMTRRYPFYVLDIDMPCDNVDVNVHPKKTEVRFADLKAVCSAFYRAVADELAKYDKARLSSRLGVDEDRPDAAELSRRFKFQEETEKRISELLSTNQIEVMNSGQADDVIEIERSTEEVDREAEFIRFADKIGSELSVEKARQKMGFTDEDTSLKISQKQIVLSTTSADEEIEKLMPPLVAETDIYDDLYSRTRILGAAFKTYLILEIDDKIILVDQHAAHERILFDKFMQAKNKDFQPLIFPYVFQVKEDEAAFIDENIDNIKSAGIDIEPFGINTYRIKAVSTVLSGARMGEFVQYLLSSVDEFKIDDKELIVEKIAQKACKAAIKGGYCLNEYEIKYILKEVYENNVVQCPHGRPVSVVYTKRQIEKIFKRIV